MVEARNTSPYSPLDRHTPPFRFFCTATAPARTTGVDAREWCKRMGRTLAAILDPLGTGHTAAAGAAAAAGGPAFAIAPPPTTSGAGAKAAQLPGGYNAVAGFSALGFGGGSSSDESSGDESEVRRMTREQRLQRKLGLDGKKKKGTTKPAGMCAEMLQNRLTVLVVLSVLAHAHVSKERCPFGWMRICRDAQMLHCLVPCQVHMGIRHVHVAIVQYVYP